MTAATTGGVRRHTTPAVPAYEPPNAGRRVWWFVVAGLAYGANRLGISQVWIIAGALVIVGLGIMGGIVKTRQKDPAP